MKNKLFCTFSTWNLEDLSTFDLYSAKSLIFHFVQQLFYRLSFVSNLLKIFAHLQTTLFLKCINILNLSFIFEPEIALNVSTYHKLSLFLT